MDAELVHDAARLALEVARDGRRSDPPVPPPAGLGPILRFKKLSAASLATIVRTVDGDEAFRTRVADAADEQRVGRIGLLWLQRPEGWEHAIAELSAERGDARGGHDRGGSLKRLERERDGAEAAAERARADAVRADAARERAETRLAELRGSAAEDRAELLELRSAVEALEEERRRVLREMKGTEAKLADARHDLRVAREATREAEQELADLRARAGQTKGRTEGHRPGELPAPSRPLGPPRDPGPDLDLDRIRRAVAAVAGAAGELASSFTDVADALAPNDPGETRSAAGPDDAHRHLGRGPAAGRRGGRRRSRTRPALPFAIHDDSPEARRAWVTDPANLIHVDGYNLARTAWDGLAMEEERRRVVGILEEVQARSGGRIVVVFDGRDGSIGPAASRTVAVRFSPSGMTADDVLVDAISACPDEVPVVLVTSDRDLRRRAEEVGAATVSSADFLAAVGR